MRPRPKEYETKEREQTPSALPVAAPDRGPEAEPAEADPRPEEVPRPKEAAPIRLPLAVKLGCALIIVLALCGFAGQLMQYNDLREQTARLEREITDYERKIARMQYLVGAPLDPDYIQQTAREKLGLYPPDAILYYNDLSAPETGD